ncbi:MULTISPECIES: YegS/Rv2252/BmrU family lipid kinase [Nocardioides]|uniref:YegS/Rv2252/BmrU family lipid kinase n=1 Tax=Nocardioides vastitatis TaxID=2568655 RepID=A0ABW0ZLG9_9ACTN|nr:YegS/Rv2252/BmrU family lipid kinase [Nocardioides sp.]
MLDRPRQTPLLASLICLGLFAALAGGVASEWSWLGDLDNRGEPTSAWALDQSWLLQSLRWVEIAFGTHAMTVLTVVLAAFMFIKGHRRAAILVVVVMSATALATYGAKVLVGRGRPLWQDPDFFLQSNAFPSGHASSTTAYGALVLVLAVMLVRRAGVRRLLAALVVLVVAVVLADRVLLGRHYPTDVLGGGLLGLGLVLLGIAIYSPLPRSHAFKAEPLPEAIPSHRNLSVILNPIKVESVEQFQSMVTQMALAAGWNEPRWHLTTVDDSGTGQAEQASVEGADLVIVCGGDGTVRQVCAELAGTGIPVGIVPAGTGNLLARNLDIPLFIRAAIDVALTGQDRAIDMVEVHGDGVEKTHFMVMAGMGFDAAIMEGVNEDIKKKVGWLAYVLSALKSLMFPPAKVEISVDDGEWTKHRARTIVVGNVGYLQAGMPLLPDAAIDDGRLDVVLLYPQRFWSWLPLAFRVLAKRPYTDETINRMTGRKVSIRAAQETPRQLDGDTIGPGCELHMECIHGRVLVRVPR